MASRRFSRSFWRARAGRRTDDPINDPGGDGGSDERDSAIRDGIPAGNGLAVAATHGLEGFVEFGGCIASGFEVFDQGIGTDEREFRQGCTAVASIALEHEVTEDASRAVQPETQIDGFCFLEIKLPEEVVRFPW